MYLSPASKCLCHIYHVVSVPCNTMSLLSVSQCLCPLYHGIYIPCITESLSHVLQYLCTLYHSAYVPCITVYLSHVSQSICLLYPSGLSVVSQYLCPLVLLSPVCLCDEHYISCLMIGASLACSYNKPEYTVHNNILASLSNSSCLYWYKICYFLLVGVKLWKIRISCVGVKTHCFVCCCCCCIIVVQDFFRWLSMDYVIRHWYMMDYYSCLILSGMIV